MNDENNFTTKVPILLLGIYQKVSGMYEDE